MILNKRRTWVFDLLLGLVVCFLLFLFFESLLFIADFHYKPGMYFFIEHNPYYRHLSLDIYSYRGYEDMFSYQGRALEDDAFVIDFSKKKPRNEYRIFLIGGSVADGLAGYLYLLEEKLEQEYPQYNFVIVDYGVGSFGTNRIMQFYHELFSFSPDLILVHSGNNEFSEPILSSSLESDSFALHYINNILLHSRLYQYLSYIAKDKIMPFFYLDSSLYTLPGYDWECPLDKQEVYNNYEKNLKEMAHWAKIYDVDIIFSTLGRNYVVGMESNDTFNPFALILEGDIHRAILEATYFDEPCPYFITDEMNDIVRKLCVNLEIPCVDIDQSIIENFAPGTIGHEYFIDAMHYADNYNTSYVTYSITHNGDAPLFMDYVARIESGYYENMSLTSLPDLWTSEFFKTIVVSGVVQ